MKVRVAGAVAQKKTIIAKTKSKAKSPTKRDLEAEERKIAELILNHRENGRKLARSILRRWRVRMPSDEIDSIVDLALCEAARRFSSDHGATFMTFFFYHLRGHLVRSVTRAAQSSNLFMAFAQNNGVDTAEWQYLHNELVWPYLPDHFLFGHRDVTTPEHEILRKEKIDQCRAAIKQLDELEKEIVSRSFGEEQPLVDIANSLGYSRCHISRVKKSALDRLRLMLSGKESGQAETETSEPEPIEEETPLVDRTAAAARTSARRRSRRRTISGREQLPVRKTKAA